MYLVHVFLVEYHAVFAVKSFCVFYYFVDVTLFSYVASILKMATQKQATTSAAKLTKFPFDRFKEHQRYSVELYQTGLFPRPTTKEQAHLTSATVSFRFRAVEFNKKRVLPFFIALELLTNQKSVASLSKRNVLSWKIRKGRLVGCKVTLRGTGLSYFLDTLSLSLPRREKFQPANRTKELKKVYSLLSSNQGANSTKPTGFGSTKPLATKTNSFGLTLSELVLFYPVEVGLGLHQDVQRVQVRFLFSTLSVEERFFLLRSVQVPVI